MRDVAAELAEIPLFASLSEEQRRDLADRFEVRVVGPGTRLVGEGAAGYSFFVLVEGRATATAGDVVLRSLGQGDFFGEIGLLGNGPRTATVTTTSESTVLVMFGTEFRRLEAELPATAAAVEAEMHARLSAG